MPKRAANALRIAGYTAVRVIWGRITGKEGSSYFCLRLPPWSYHHHTRCWFSYFPVPASSSGSHSPFPTGSTGTRCRRSSHGSHHYTSRSRPLKHSLSYWSEWTQKGGL